MFHVIKNKKNIKIYFKTRKINKKRGYFISFKKYEYLLKAKNVTGNSHTLSWALVGPFVSPGSYESAPFGALDWTRPLSIKQFNFTERLTATRGRVA